MRSREELLLDLLYGEEGEITKEEQAYLEEPDFQKELMEFQSLLGELDQVDPAKGHEPSTRAGGDSERGFERSSSQFQDRIMDLEDLADFLQIPMQELEVSLGKIPHFRVSGHLRFRLSSIQQWLDDLENGQDRVSNSKRGEVIRFEDFLNRRVI